MHDGKDQQGPHPACYIQHTSNAAMCPCVESLNATYEGSLITLEFVDFCLERSSNCTFDYVELREGSSRRDDVRDGEVGSGRGRLVGRLCGDGVTGVFYTTAAVLNVKFASDPSVECRGFWAFYRQTREQRLLSFQTTISRSKVKVT